MRRGIIMPETLEEKLSRLENKLKANLFDVEKRLVALESRGEEEGVQAGIPQDINERFLEMEDLILLIQTENTKVRELLGKEPLTGTATGAELPADLEEKISALEAKLSAKPELPENIDMRLKNTAAKIAAVEAGWKALEKSIGEEVAGLRESIPAKFSSREMESYFGRLKDAKRDIDEEFARLQSAKEDMESLRKESSELLGKAAQAEINAEKAETYLEKMKTLEEKMEADIDRIGSMRDSIDSRLKFSVERVDLAKKDVDMKIQNLEDKFRLRLEKLDSIRESLENKLRMLDEKAKEFGKIEDLTSMKRALDEESISRVSMEKHIADMNKKLADLESLSQDIDEESLQRVTLEKRLQDVQAKISGIEKVKSELHATKQEVEEAAKRGIAVLEEKLSTYQYPAGIKEVKENFEKESSAKLSQLSGDIEKMRAALQEEAKQVREVMQADDVKKLREDITQQRGMLQNIEKNLELSATRFFSSNLEEFAKALDRRLPNLVTRDEYVRDIRELAGKLRSVESPDLGAFARRVEYLEKKIDDIYQMTRNVSSRMPVVVE